MNAAEKARLAREQAQKEEEINKSKKEEQGELEKVKKQIHQISTSKKWSTVKFGTYYINSGKEPIEWIVLENFGDIITLVSKNVLDCYNFYENENRNCSWEKSDIRVWLNGEFLEKAFSKIEQGFIQNQKIDSLCHNSNICTTLDKVYLLSQLDIKKGKTLFGNKLKKCKPTKYALSKSIIGGRKKCFWWLRDIYSSGYYSHDFVYCGGLQKSVCLNDSSDNDYLSKADVKRVGVRPVITIKTDI